MKFLVISAPFRTNCRKKQRGYPLHLFFKVASQLDETCYYTQKPLKTLVLQNRFGVIDLQHCHSFGNHHWEQLQQNLTNILLKILFKLIIKLNYYYYLNKQLVTYPNFKLLDIYRDLEE